MAKQKTFSVIPELPSFLGGNANLDNAARRPSKPPMTTKQAKKLYKEANKGPKLSKAQQRRQDLMEQDRIRKELEKEKNQARAQKARDKRKEKEEKEKAERRKKGLPLVDVHPSQDTLARFMRMPMPKKKAETKVQPKPEPAAVPDVSSVVSEGDYDSDRTMVAEADNERPYKRRRIGNSPVVESASHVVANRDIFSGLEEKEMDVNIDDVSRKDSTPKSGGFDVDDVSTKEMMDQRTLNDSFSVDEGLLDNLDDWTAVESVQGGSDESPTHLLPETSEESCNHVSPAKEPFTLTEPTPKETTKETPKETPEETAQETTAAKEASHASLPSGSRHTPHSTTSSSTSSAQTKDNPAARDDTRSQLQGQIGRHRSQVSQNVADSRSETHQSPPKHKPTPETTAAIATTSTRTAGVKSNARPVPPYSGVKKPLQSIPLNRVSAATLNITAYKPVKPSNGYVTAGKTPQPPMRTSGPGSFRSHKMPSMGPPPAPPRFRSSNHPSGVGTTVSNPGKFLQHNKHTLSNQSPVSKRPPEAAASKSPLELTAPLSTQALLSNIDDLFPSPSQEMKEICGESIPKRKPDPPAPPSCRIESMAPISTQALLDNLSLFPTPSQEAKELFEESIPTPKPNPPPPLPRKFAPPPRSRRTYSAILPSPAPVKTSRTTHQTVAKQSVSTPGRQGQSANATTPVRTSNDTGDLDYTCLFSTQDIFLSSQDLHEVEYVTSSTKARKIDVSKPSANSRSGPADSCLVTNPSKHVEATSFSGVQAVVPAPKPRPTLRERNDFMTRPESNLVHKINPVGNDADRSTLGPKPSTKPQTDSRNHHSLKPSSRESPRGSDMHRDSRYACTSSISHSENGCTADAPHAIRSESQSDQDLLLPPSGQQPQERTPSRETPRHSPKPFFTSSGTREMMLVAIERSKASARADAYARRKAEDLLRRESANLERLLLEDLEAEERSVTTTSVSPQAGDNGSAQFRVEEIIPESPPSRPLSRPPSQRRKSGSQAKANGSRAKSSYHRMMEVVEELEKAKPHHHQSVIPASQETDYGDDEWDDELCGFP